MSLTNTYLRKTMSDEDLEANIEWGQAKSFSKNTRISRRLDQKKAMIADASSRNDFKKTNNNIKKVAPNLKKIQSKIRDVYDEEDDEEDDKSVVVFDLSFDDMSSSLYTALSDEERTKMYASKDFENQKMQQTAGKVAGILQANEISKELGLKEIDKKDIAKTTRDVTFDGKTLENTLLKNISSQTKLKTDNLSSKDAENLVKGLDKVKQAKVLNKKDNLEKLSENMNTKDFIEIGKEKNIKKTAKLILEKSGRKEDKKQTKEKQQEKREKLKNIEKSLKKVKTR